MSRHFSSLVRCSIWLACGPLCTLLAGGMTVTGLQKVLAAGDKITVIDVRATEVFTQGHIPGAINIPASLCAQKHLPPLGKVIVYGAGLGADATVAATEALAHKPGITAEILEGGYAAWQTAQGLNTQAGGVKPDQHPYIIYKELRAADAGGMVLVDLRKRPAAESKLAVGGVSTNAPLTDLSKEFPGLTVMESLGASIKPAVSGRQGGVPPLLVLIDSGDGAAQAMGRILKANGTRRYTILAGGEWILARHGESGLQRRNNGPALPIQAQAPIAPVK